MRYVTIEYDLRNDDIVTDMAELFVRDVEEYLAKWVEFKTLYPEA